MKWFLGWNLFKGKEDFFLNIFSTDFSELLTRWEFTGKPDPGVDEVTNGLKRLVTGVLTHPMTIGKAISAYTPKRKKDKPKSIHLIGTDTPEVNTTITSN